MALINKPIPTLIGGISQQPASLRHPSQVDLMENCIPSPATGVRKRVGTKAIARLSTSAMYGDFVQWINRGTPGTTERYSVVVSNGDLKVFDWNGTAQVVNFPDGKAYLSSTTPRDEFSAVTVADYTFLVNKTKTVAMSAATPFTPVQTLYVMVKQGVPDARYTVTLNGTPYTYTTTSSTAYIKTDDTAASLAAVIAAGGYTASASGSLITITSASSFTFDVFDSYGNTAMFAFQDRVARFETLPARFVENVVVKVAGSASAPQGSDPAWYVKWKKNASNSDGVWEECVAPGYATTLDASTMPHKLVRNADATWTFSRTTWTDRLVGDDVVNPLPSFVGQTISKVFFHRNRLGFLSDENAVMSQAGHYYNFFATTARAVIDSDPIDIAASSTKVTLLRSVLNFDKTLLVFSDRQQFVIAANEVLSPRTARLDPATAFACSTTCDPVGLGKNAFFVEPRGLYSGIREYFVNNQLITNDADDVTAHCTAYVPSGVFKLASCPERDMVFALTTQETGSFYTYNSFWRGEERVQSAWHKWPLVGNASIVSCEAYGTTLAMIVDRDDGAWFETVELEENPYYLTGWPVCLDRLYLTSSGTYDSASGTTSWALPYTELRSMQVVVIDKVGEEGQVIDADQPNSTTVSVRGDYSGVNVYVGVKFNQRIRLSTLYYRDPQGLSVIDGRLQLRNLTIAMAETGYFAATVQPLGRTLNYYAFPSKPLGLAGLRVGARVLTSGSYSFPVMAKNDEVTIELVNDTALPSRFQSAEWDGVFAMRAQRR